MAETEMKLLRKHLENAPPVIFLPEFKMSLLRYVATSLGRI